MMFGGTSTETMIIQSRKTKRNVFSKRTNITKIDLEKKHLMSEPKTGIYSMDSREFKSHI